MRITTLAAIGAIATVALSGCAIDHSKPDASKPTVRIAYQTFPSGDLIVKNNKWLEEALPDYNIKWIKFDSGADVNTAFIAKKLDFGALGSSPVARGLSAPLNIPYKVAFVLDVLGDNPTYSPSEKTRGADGALTRAHPRFSQPLNRCMNPRVAYSPTTADRINSTMKVSSQLVRLCGTFHHTRVNIAAQRKTKMSRQLPR